MITLSYADTDTGFDVAAEDAALQRIPTGELHIAAQSTRREALRAQARSVMIAGRIADARCREIMERTVNGLPLPVDRWDKAAIGEVSLQFSISRSKARKWVETADALASLPQARLAFLDGQFTPERAWLLTAALTTISNVDTRTFAEPLAVTLVNRPTADTTLRHQLDELVIAVDPAAAAEAREDFGAWNQNVTIRSDVHGHSALNGCVPAEIGRHIAAQRAAMLARRVCRHDRRRVGEQRVIALAEIHGVPGIRLTCGCGRADCLVSTESTPDVPTDVEVLPESGCGLDVPTPDEPTAIEDAPADPIDGPSEPEPNGVTVVVDPLEKLLPWLRGHGPVDPAHASTIVANKQAAPVQPILPGLIVTHRPDPLPGPPDTPEPPEAPEQPDSLTAIVEILTSGLAPPIDRTGHGGFTTPPLKAALRYRPTEGLRAQIFDWDHTCRYPNCGRPSEDCQLDHVVPFNHENPLAGGWTIGENLAPLCTPDHHRKHLGLWLPTMRADRSITWHNPDTGQQITTYPR